MRWVGITLAALIGCFGVAVLASWILMSYGTFPNRVLPGGTYSVDGRTYRVPRLPHATYGTKQTPSLDRAVPMLSHKLLADLRALMIDTYATLEESGTEYWATGGTLIAALLWRYASLAWDDDADCAVNMKDRAYLWSSEFAALLAARGLETFYLRGASLEFATREGAAVRVRRRGTITPTLDIFFVHERPDGACAKVDSWRGAEFTYNRKETWDSVDWIYPLRRVQLDGFSCTIARRAEDMLTRQYGPKWSSALLSPKPLIATHQWAFWVSNLAHAWRRGEVSAATNKKRLRNPRAPGQRRVQFEDATGAAQKTTAAGDS